MYVIPLAGRHVPDPVKGDVLPEHGRNVADDVYWYRRIKDGDVKRLTDAEGAALQAKEGQRQSAVAKINKKEPKGGEQ